MAPRRRFASAFLLICGLLTAAPASPPAAQGRDFVHAVRLDEAWKGDLSGMVERGRIRVLVASNHTHYFLDGGQPRGITYEAISLFAKELNESLGRKRHPVQIVFVPVARERLVPDLVEGRGDLAAASLTVTPARLEEVDFGKPLVRSVHEILVTGPGAGAEPPPASPEELSGREVFVRPSSSYRESLDALNRRLREAGRDPVRIVDADERLEDEDLLQMVAAGLAPATVVDSHGARLWAEVLPDLRLHPKVALRTDGELAWAFRKGSPELREAVDAFATTHHKGTLEANVVLKRYLTSTRWVRNALAETDRARFRGLSGLFRSYGERFELDWMLLAAQGYQESGLDHSVRSAAGAVGIMQLLPSTAAAPPVSVSDIHELEPNVHAGAKYMRILMDRYFDEPELDELDRHLIALAAYNSGPTRMVRLLQETQARGLDPHEWFGNVELVVGAKVGRETVVYVGNIYKYYVSYRLLAARAEERKELRSPAQAAAVR